MRNSEHAASAFGCREVTVATTKKSPIHREKTVHDGTNLTSQEETVHRMQEGIGASNDKMLERKTKDPELLARLLELERALIEKARTRS